MTQRLETIANVTMQRTAGCDHSVRQYMQRYSYNIITDHFHVAIVA